MKQKFLILSLLTIILSSYTCNAQDGVIMPKNIFENELKITEQEQVLLNEYNKTTTAPVTQKPVTPQPVAIKPIVLTMTPAKTIQPIKQVATVVKPQLPNNFNITKSIGYFNAKYEDLVSIFISELNNAKYTLISTDTSMGRFLFVANGRAFLAIYNSKKQNNFVIRIVPLDDNFNAQLQFIPTLFQNMKLKLQQLQTVQTTP